MSFHSRPIRTATRAKLRIALAGAFAKDYDIDGVGHDDGTNRDPDAPLEFVLRLGLELEIFEYVVALPRGVTRTAGDSLFLVDSAVAVIEASNFGPPRRVECTPVTLPSVFANAHVSAGDESRESFDVDALTFEARPASAEGGGAIVSWLLRDARGERVDVRWSRREGWVVERSQSPRAMRDGEKLTFTNPIRAPG